MSMSSAEAIAITVLTLAAVIARPRDLDEGLAALAGGVLVLVFGLVSIGHAIRLELGAWNVYLFFLGMMAIAGLADQSGVFDWVAYGASRAAGGRVLRLYLLLFFVGAGVAILFANDSAALVLTPIVYALVVRLSLDPLPFVFATTFIADTASVALPVSNPLNIIVADRFGIGLGPYVSRLWLPAALAIAVNLVVFLVLFRRQIRGRFRIGQPHEHARPTRAAVILCLLAMGYLLSSASGFPLGITACVGAGVLAVDLLIRRALDPGRLFRDINPSIFAFLAGLQLVVEGLTGADVTGHLGLALVRVAGSSHLGAIAASAVGAALGSNVINNLPMALVMVSAVSSVPASQSVRLDLVYGTIVGCDLGPNLTHLGSLATLIWLLFLRRKGLDVSTWDYFRIGMLVMPLTLAAAILGLWITAP